MPPSVPGQATRRATASRVPRGTAARESGIRAGKKLRLVEARFGSRSLAVCRHRAPLSHDFPRLGLEGPRGRTEQQCPAFPGSRLPDARLVRGLSSGRGSRLRTRDRASPGARISVSTGVGPTLGGCHAAPSLLRLLLRSDPLSRGYPVECRRSRLPSVRQVSAPLRRDLRGTTAGGRHWECGRCHRGASAGDYRGLQWRRRPFSRFGPRLPGPLAEALRYRARAIGDRVPVIESSPYRKIDGAKPPSGGRPAAVEVADQRLLASSSGYAQGSREYNRESIVPQTEPSAKRAPRSCTVMAAGWPQIPY